MKRAIALVTESTRRDRTRQGFAAPRPVGAPLTEPAPPPKKDRLRGRCPSESSPGSRAPNPDSSHSNWTILWGQVSISRLRGECLNRASAPGGALRTRGRGRCGIRLWVALQSLCRRGPCQGSMK